MNEEIKLEFPKNNVLSDSYRAQLVIEEIGYKTLYFHFRKVNDPRMPQGKRHSLIHIFILTIIGLLRGHSDFDNMVDDLKYDEEELTEKLGLKHGIPSHDTFSRVFRIIDAREFMHAFIDWTYSFVSLVNEHVAIDGKAVRAATEKINSQNAPYLVNSFVCGQKVVLGQLLIDKKTNEITAIPELIELLDLEGCTVTIDAIGCQRKICELLHDKNADFVLPAKENQKLMHEAIELFVRDAYNEWLKEEKRVKNHRVRNTNALPYHKKVDVFHEVEPKAEHGREPGDRMYIVVDDTSMIDGDLWPHVKAVAYTKRIRTVIKRNSKGEDVSETSIEYNTWILSRKMTAKEFAVYAKGHWAIENSLHYVTDTVMREDWSTARKDSAIENLGNMRKICYNFMNLDPAVKGKSKKKAFNYYRHNIDAVIKLIFFEIPKSEHSE